VRTRPANRKVGRVFSAAGFGTLRLVTTALKNIRVLDMSRVLAGPWAGQLLGDYGADVVKVERPGAGDDTRLWGPPWLGGRDDGESAYFLSTNRNKRSVTIDIATPAGQALVLDLVRQADIVLENFKVGALDRFGLDASSMLAANPRVIVCSISGFGRSGARATEPGYDAMIQASGGLMSITGAPDAEGGGPQKVGVAIADIMAGMYAVTAVLAALNARATTGCGQHIDVPLYDSQVAWLANQNMNFLIGGMVPGRMGTAHPNLVPYQAFPTADGAIMLAVGNDRQFAATMRCLGLDAYIEDPRYQRNRDRICNRESLVDLMSRAFRARDSAHWIDALMKCGVPTGPINDIEEVLTNDHARERGLVKTIANSQGEPVPMVANPVEFMSTPVCYDRAPPLLGEHTEEVLREWLGYSAQRIDALRDDAVI